MLPFAGTSYYRMQVALERGPRGARVAGGVYSGLLNRPGTTHARADVSRTIPFGPGPAAGRDAGGDAVGGRSSDRAGRSDR